MEEAVPDGGPRVDLDSRQKAANLRITRGSSGMPQP